MANLTLDEFREAIDLLAQDMGLQRLRDRFGQMNAFTSRSGLNSSAAIADRVFRLSGGLRLRVAATYAFTALWTDMVRTKLGEDGEKAVESVADEVNACLAPDETIVAGKEDELDRALASYRDKVAAVSTPAIARLDMLLKAVPAVAARVRATATPAG